MAVFRNYYEILGVDASADAATIKAAFRKLARQYHPDLNTDKHQSEEQFKLLNEAYDILSHPEKRKAYELSMKAMGILKATGPGDTSSKKAEEKKSEDRKANDKKSGGKPPGNKQNTDRQPNSDTQQKQKKETVNETQKEPQKETIDPKPSISKPIQDLFGSFLKKEFTPSSEQGVFRTKPDPNLNQSNTNPSNSNAQNTKQPDLPNLNERRNQQQDTKQASSPQFASKQSAGRVGPEYSQSSRGEDIILKTVLTHNEAMEGLIKTISVQHQETCKRCSGTGKVSGMICNGCRGEKILSRVRKIDVRIPAGVKQNSRVRVAKEGGAGSAGGEGGDLFLQIEILQDVAANDRSKEKEKATSKDKDNSKEASFRIEGMDVFGNKQLTVTEAVLGGEIEVKTLHGQVKMSIPAGTQVGRVFRLKGQGIHHGGEKGDHLLTVSVLIPERLSETEKALYQELARLRAGK